MAPNWFLQARQDLHPRQRAFSWISYSMDMNNTPATLVTDAVSVATATTTIMEHVGLPHRVPFVRISQTMRLDDTPARGASDTSGVDTVPSKLIPPHNSRLLLTQALTTPPRVYPHPHNPRLTDNHASPVVEPTSSYYTPQVHTSSVPPSQSRLAAVVMAAAPCLP